MQCVVCVRTLVAHGGVQHVDIRGRQANPVDGVRHQLAVGPDRWRTCRRVAEAHHPVVGVAVVGSHRGGVVGDE